MLASRVSGMIFALTVLLVVAFGVGWIATPNVIRLGTIGRLFRTKEVD